MTRRGLTTGILANFTALGTQVLVQLLAVPVLSTAYGVEGFGIWLLLATIPIYLTMSDLGLLTAATNELSIQWARGDEEGAQATFQSVGVTVVSIAVLVVAIVTLFVWASGSIDGFWPDEIRPHLAVIPILTGYAALVLISLVMIAAIRGTGHFARGTLVSEASVLLEGLGMLGTAALTRDMTLAAATMLIVRLLSTPYMYFEMRHLRPEIRVGTRHASRTEIRRLLPSALGVLTIPGSIAISLQGTTIIVGAMLGPAALAVFASARTASRFSVQVVGMVVRAIVPELAAAHGRGDFAVERHYWALFNKLRLMVLLPAAVAFAVFGQWAVRIWSVGKLEPSFALVAVMGGGLVAHGFWFLDFFMLTATHRHVRLARPILIGSLLGLPLTALAIKFGGVVGAAVTVAVVDLCLSLIVWRHLRQQRSLQSAATAIPGEKAQQH